MISEEDGSPMKFTDEQLKEIEQLAGINYSVRQIAMYFEFDKAELQKEFEDKESVFRYHYDRGQLIAQAEIDKATLESAKKGNITAQLRYDKKLKDLTIKQAKERIFGRS